ncbi:TIM barrel protein [Kineococcus rubinsiae]|uniref:TIM barrel protein n=1 Tax=Kineococcus rubinsiae TaxID=2609562 RepID=UPI00143026EF|nr:TIM barrel protein [Kineococcus rubinsiae]
MTGPAIAGAPVSFGVWGPHTGPADGDGRAVLAKLAAAGYRGSELGPTGYLGDPDRTADGFAAAGLVPAGVYVGLELAAGRWTPEGRAALDLACRTLRAVADRCGVPGVPAAPIVLADEGAPGLDGPRDPRDTASGLDADAWAGAARMLTEARAVVAGHGLPATFHPHLGTFVESGWEVERLLATTASTVVLDTGHALLAGTDPVAAVAAWGARVDHVHLKDVATAVPAQARRGGPVPLRDWWSQANVTFGRGDVDLAGVLLALQRRDYGGWLVVEQDVAPHGGPQLTEFAQDQRHNLRTLRDLLGPPGSRALPHPAAGSTDRGPRQ